MPHTTVPAAAGRNHHHNLELARRYLRYHDQHNRPGCRELYDRFGDALERALRAALPDGKLRGVLQHREGDIRQDAAAELLGGFLAGHPELHAAVRSRDIARIASCLGRSIGACIGNCKKRERHKILKRLAKETVMAPEDLPQSSECKSAEAGVHEHEHKMRKRVAEILRSRATHMELRKEDIMLLQMLLVDECRRKDVARMIGRCEAWISKRVRQIVLRLRKSKSIRPHLEID